MNKISFKYHYSIFIWSGAAVAIGLARGAEGLAVSLVVGVWLAIFSAIARWRSQITLDEAELTVQKLSGTISIPLNQISTIEHQKSVFGSYGIIRITTTGGRSIKVNRIPNVELFVKEVKIRMKS